MAKIKKAQNGKEIAEFLKKRAAADTTKMYNREEALASYSKLKPKLEGPTQFVDAQGSKKYATVNKGDTTYMGKTEFEKKYAKKKAGGKLVKKAKSGGSFPDLNKDGKITKADILKGRGVIAKKGAKVKAKPCMTCGGKMKMGGKSKKK